MKGPVVIGNSVETHFSFCQGKEVHLHRGTVSNPSPDIRPKVRANGESGDGNVSLVGNDDVYTVTVQVLRKSRGSPSVLEGKGTTKETET